MVAGQGVLSRTLDVGALTAVEERLEQRRLARGAAHVADLRDALELHRLYVDVGMRLTTVSHLALVLRCSEMRAGELLADAQLLVSLPGAFDALAAGVLSVDDSRVLAAQLAPLSEDAQQAVWQRLHARLLLDAALGVVRPPARLREDVRRLVIRIDPRGAEQRRRAAADGRGVDYRRRDDGLVDLFAVGLSAPNAQACLSRINAAAAPLGPADPRTADQRRLDAFVSLLLGRERLPLDADGGRLTDGPTGAGGCGCSATSPVPCGAQVTVLVPLGAALGTTDEVAEVVGHGPVEPDLLDALLLGSPELRAVFVDAAGVPVAAGGKATPERGDLAELRAALLRLAGSAPPTERVPRHPDDHAPGRPPGHASGGPRVLCHPHSAGTPGPYRVPASLRRFLRVRAHRCEWPGCGTRAERCDLDHDLAWPFGATCGCNLGPLCRRHHRIKQEGWAKTRTADGVRWTSPAGRSWLSPAQHSPPAQPIRPLGAAPAATGWEHLSPLEREQALWDLDPSDPRLDGSEPSDALPEDVEPDEDDRVRAALLDDLTRWTLDLDDPYAWSGR